MKRFNTMNMKDLNLQRLIMFQKGFMTQPLNLEIRQLDSRISSNRSSITSS
jgi:hypothetical protein